MKLKFFLNSNLLIYEYRIPFLNQDKKALAMFKIAFYSDFSRGLHVKTWKGCIISEVSNIHDSQLDNDYYLISIVEIRS